SSSNLAVGTVGSATGIVRGISTGTTTITYHQSGGCFVTTEATVNTSITANTGDNNLCVAGATSLANVTGGGTWSSGTITKATVGSLTGIVTGVASGTAVISYKVTPSCYATSVVTVAASPAAIGGSGYVCIDADVTLTHAVPGGTWSSSNPAKGTIDVNTGVLRGIASGSTVVTYVPSNGCFVTKTMNIANNPPAISGTMGICVGGSSALTCVIGGSATWSSSNPAVGTIGLTSGMLTGLSSGTTTITYRLNTTGCYSVREATVNPLPAAISGSNTICVGSSATYTNATGGGTWSTSNSAIANIGSASGIAAAGTAGVTTVSYTLSTGCRAVKVITVNTLPAAITGTTNFCVGGVGVLASSTGGGVWTSDNVAASVAGSGTVTATGSGSSVISYTLATGCARTATVNVSPALAANTGNDVICVGGTTTLANVTPGGTWTSSVTAKATVGGTTGIVTGVSTGTSNITYKASGVGCTAITQVTVNAALAAITGTTNVCVGDVTSLAHAVPGGTWSSSNTGLATVDNMTGAVTGVAAGIPTITYTALPGCFKTAAVTVKALPSVIGGTLSVCAGSSTTLSASPSGGTWTSSNTGVALANLTTGAMVGVAAGTATITYKGSNLCIRTAVGTVNALPATIGGTLTASVTGTSTLTNATPGGAWTSSNITKATVDNMTGEVTGVAVGTSVITYTLPTGCFRTATFSVTASKPGGTVYFTNNDNKVIFSVFPNPTKGAFTIEAPAAGTFSVYTVDGKLVSEYIVNSQTTNVNLPADLAYGVYMCRFDQEDGESTIVRLWYQP
ncbi:MAG: Ig-like domain-containing protein, partial [Flavipsychrobacter sp.]|nr:Ig-like domain-containing protein [Flavipsychrobacter sp.]